MTTEWKRYPDEKPNDLDECLIFVKCEGHSLANFYIDEDGSEGFYCVETPAVKRMEVVYWRLLDEPENPVF